MPQYLPSRYRNLPDIANDETEEIIDEMIAEIESVYGQAYEELRKKADDYLAWFTKMDEEMYKKVLAGIITKQEWQNWRFNKLLTGQRWFAMAETMAVDLSNANGIAYSIINDYVPEVYSINGNWVTYNIERQTQVNTVFTLYNHEAIERLIREHPDLLPRASVNIPLDKRWNKQNLQSAVMQSILQGEDVYQLADRLAAVSDMNEKSSIRNARTMMTSAQNMGRQDAYERMESMGIQQKKIWVATLDFRTRESHRKMDGVAVAVKAKFPNGLIEPGDPSGKPEEVYNCRCTTVTIPLDDDFSKHERNSKLGDMSYEEWKNAHGGEPEFKSARNKKRDRKMWREYQTLLKKQVPKKFTDFQDLKYNNPDEWKKMISDARKARNKRRRDGDKSRS